MTCMIHRPVLTADEAEKTPFRTRRTFWVRNLHVVHSILDGGGPFHSSDIDIYVSSLPRES